MVEEKISEIKSYAKENNVPIMMDDGIDFLTSLIRQRKVKNILEIGTALYAQYAIDFLNKYEK